jgi:hypothetical protein
MYYGFNKANFPARIAFRVTKIDSEHSGYSRCQLIGRGICFTNGNDVVESTMFY